MSKVDLTFLSEDDYFTAPWVIRDKTISGLHYQAVRTIKNNGYFLTDERDEEIQELYNMFLVLEGSGIDLSKNPTRKLFQLDFAEGLLNYDIAVKKAKAFHYAYGYQLMINDNLKRAVERLGEEPASRRCWIPILSTDQVCIDDEVPCWVGTDLKIRDNKLLMTNVFRSNDMYGAFDSDLFGERALQRSIAQKKGIEVGMCCHLSISAHLRLSDMDGINKLLGAVV